MGNCLRGFSGIYLADGVNLACSRWWGDMVEFSTQSIKEVILSVLPFSLLVAPSEQYAYGLSYEILRCISETL